MNVRNLKVHLKAILSDFIRLNVDDRSVKRHTSIFYDIWIIFFWSLRERRDTFWEKLDTKKMRSFAHEMSSTVCVKSYTVMSTLVNRNLKCDWMNTHVLIFCSEKKNEQIRKNQVDDRKLTTIDVKKTKMIESRYSWKYDDKTRHERNAALE